MSEQAAESDALAQAQADAKAWEQNYDGMFWRWVECDNERLRLKEELADAKMRMRLLTPSGGSATAGTSLVGQPAREVAAAPSEGLLRRLFKRSTSSGQQP